MKHILAALTVAFLYLLPITALPQPQAASGEQTKVLQASKDNTLIESAKGELSSGSGPTMFVGRTGQSEASIRRGLLAFDIAGAIPAGSKITSVKLTLNLKMSAGGGRPAQVTLYRVLSDWGEGSASSEGGRGAPAVEGDTTWIHTFYPKSLWSHPGGDYATEASAVQTVSKMGVYTWDSTPQMVADVQAWLETPTKNFGWLLHGDEKEGATAKVFQTRQSDEEAGRPQLTVTFTPPAAPKK